MEGTRGRRRRLIGVVVSDRMDKTITVDVERIAADPVVEKRVRRYTRCYAHDERNEARTGDVVEIMETRPLSRLKRWRLVRIVRPAPDRSPTRGNRRVSSTAQ
jgi:small subunit ribosomal protein S17